MDSDAAVEAGARAVSNVGLQTPSGDSSLLLYHRHAGTGQLLTGQLRRVTGNYVLRKAHMCSPPSLRIILSVALETVPMFI